MYRNSYRYHCCRHADYSYLFCDLPGSTGAGTATVTGTYGGDAAHTASPASAPATITVNKDNTSTAVVCTPSSIAIGGTSTCAATVTDTVLASRTATGSVAFTLSAGTTGGVL